MNKSEKVAYKLGYKRCQVDVESDDSVVRKDSVLGWLYPDGTKHVDLPKKLVR